MHDDEFVADVALVRALVSDQFPRWADAALARVESFGTDHVMFRLGADMAVRLPRRPSAVATLDSEHIWLPRVAPHVPVRVPLPLGRGVPARGYPWPWSLCAWVDGENPSCADAALARDLGTFVQHLWAIDAAGGPGAGAHNHRRGIPLSLWEDTIATRLDWIADFDDIAAIRAAWDEDRRTSPWDGVARFIHGDLSAGNVLVRDGCLSGVIDWSCLGTGDPACDLHVAWNMFDTATRPTFRRAIGVDDATWIRGRAWALAMGVLNVSYYRTRNPAFAQLGRRTIDAVLAERRVT